MDDLIVSVIQTIFSEKGIYAFGFVWAGFERWRHIQRDKDEITRAERWATILEGNNKLLAELANGRKR